MSSEMNTPSELKNHPKTSEGSREAVESEDLCMSQSSILYLLQEATKLVTPPVQNSVEHLQGAREAMVSHGSAEVEHRVRELGTVETQPSFTGAFSMLSSSPWEAMSLINLQCERLLQSGGPRGEEDSQARSKKIDAATKEERDGMQDWSSFLSTVSTSPVVFAAAATKEHAMELDAGSSVPHVIDPTDHLSGRSSGGNSESEAVEDLAELISKTAEDGLLSCRPMKDHRTDPCSSVETSMLPLDLTKKGELSGHAAAGGEGVDEMARATFIPEAAQSPELSSVDFTSSLVAEKCEDPCFSFTKESAELECALVSGAPPPRTDLNNNLEDDVLQKPGKTRMAISAQATCSNRRRTPRKQAHPARSPDLNDPGLQGVTFTMHTEHSTDQCRLLITSNYSKLCRHGRRSRSRSSRSRQLQHSQQTSSSGEESDLSSPCEKTCASCCTRKTPLWRDAEDGTPLCNACGIRYKKYGVRCLQCWNIPRKEASFTSKCLKCGELLPLSSQSKRVGC